MYKGQPRISNGDANADDSGTYAITDSSLDGDDDCTNIHAIIYHGSNGNAVANNTNTHAISHGDSNGDVIADDTVAYAIIDSDLNGDTDAYTIANCDFNCNTYLEGVFES